MLQVPADGTRKLRLLMSRREELMPKENDANHFKNFTSMAISVMRECMTRPLMLLRASHETIEFEH